MSLNTVQNAYKVGKNKNQMKEDLQKSQRILVSPLNDSVFEKKSEISNPNYRYPIEWSKVMYIKFLYPGVQARLTHTVVG